MVIKLLYSTWSVRALALLAAVSGCCCQAIPLPGENQCPTDARRLYCSCGEEAVRRCPCGPGSEFYGLKPTCWREWPEGWQCNGCEGMPYVDPALCSEPVSEVPTNFVPTNPAPTVVTPTSPKPAVANPFRSNPGAAELPIPPQARPMVPKQSTTAQPTPMASPALEFVPTETPRAKSTPIEAVPSEESTKDKSTTQGASVVVAQPNKPIAMQAIAQVVQPDATVPQPMPIVPEAVLMPAPVPILNAPLNAPTTESVAKPNPKPFQVAVLTKAEKTQPVKKTDISQDEGSRGRTRSIGSHRTASYEQPAAVKLPSNRSPPVILKEP